MIVRFPQDVPIFKRPELVTRDALFASEIASRLEQRSKGIVVLVEVLGVRPSNTNPYKYKNDCDTAWQASSKATSGFLLVSSDCDTCEKGLSMQKRTRQQSKQDTSNEPLQPLLDIPDVMRLLKISRPTVYDLFRAGLPYIKFGRAVRISPVSLRVFLARREEVA